MDGSDERGSGQSARGNRGTAQTQARPLRFKGPVRNVECEMPRELVRLILTADEEFAAARDTNATSLA